ncbi:thioether cross-link-forming SCIFF peptide maturase [Anaerocolumna cellulosilytica]|uniref:Thioether cross-link-forming SCIFF peptide maturase n=1 Tax=Anaerocolumna cellulosilytica TaxID=433286 RepID=A0A6S6QZZ3_9FIRM|nr:radical SAM protein [Anaerocolumna cellulosilytica]MBB5197143.1 uncharacterized protein [Anaerocolumna cellulosilytica]BCJ95356.1 thioether cross-link-forming SCIFF peptide maturase [Anaerocolumna cellulosilytica]
MLFNIWVTTKCNMNCRYCYEKQQKNDKIMDQNIAQKIISFINTSVKKKEMDEPIIINFHGGEPLLNFGIIKYITNSIRQMLEKRKLYFGVTTNGTLLNDEIIDFLCDNFSYSLSISIDGYKEVNDYNRILFNGQGVHNLIIHHIEKLLEKSNDVRARMTFTSETVKYLYDSVNYLYNLGFKVIVPVADYFDSHWNHESIQCLAKELEKIYAQFPFSKRVKEDLVLGLIRDNNVRFKNGLCDPKNCAVNINYDGLLYPCSYVVNDENYAIGDVVTGIEMEKLEFIYTLSKAANEECSGCTNYDYCVSTRCKLMNKVMTGDFNKASPVFCNIENIVLEYADKYYLLG